MIDGFELQTELAELCCVVEGITFRNEVTGFAVVDVACDEKLEIVKGILPQLSPGEKLRLMGKWEHHPTYGRQFNAQFCERGLPTTNDEILKYLSSGVIRGIGPSTARKIVETFGARTMDVLDSKPEQLARIKGITHEKATRICEAFKKQFGLRQVMIALERLGMTTAECMRAHKAFGDLAAELIQKNPYILCDAAIIGFARADALACAMSDPPPPTLRLNAGVLHWMRKQSYDNGHCCVPAEMALASSAAMLNTDQKQAEDAIRTLIDDRRLIVHRIDGEERLFLPELYHAETNVAKRIDFLLRFPPAETKFGGGDVLIRMEDKHGIHYAVQQREAMQMAMERGLLILTGGPGTGKTTTLKGIYELFKEGGLKVALAAPTGRAAKRMQELTGGNAKTIHRLLEVEWTQDDKQTFSRGKSNPLDAQAVIIDEISMVDVPLFSALLNALPLGCRLVLVGDADQLPPVGAGCVLRDLLKSETMPVVRLTQIFRQTKQSRIVMGAHSIVQGKMPELERSADSDFFFMERRNPTETAKTILDLCAHRLPKAYGFNPMEDIQVLCPSRKGETGTVRLNAQLQNALNPPQKGSNAPKRELRLGSRLFREGDKVMQTKNDYELIWKIPAQGEEGKGVFNGDIGTVERVLQSEGTLRVRFEDRVVDYPAERTDDLELAFAVTVHKSQGNEFPCVVMPVSGVQEMLAYRNLLYTGFTRARKLLILVGDQWQLRRMVEGRAKVQRNTGLCTFLAEMDETR
ncbi:MAG: ATP-dependent RecD-like DNA helicase [Oscillospiraceae bacterium]|nr:ATP-dependent RecD-like DNA helicase [Oscillospiraceae bacterium]